MSREVRSEMGNGWGRKWRCRHALALGVAATIGLGVAASPRPAAAQSAPVAVTDGAGLVADYPIYQPVAPPSGYLTAIRRGTRTAAGRPGPAYWQQSVDYRIAVELEPETAVLSAQGTITVRNDTPFRRGSLLLRLYQNVFSEGVPRNRFVTLTGGITLHRVAVGGTTLPELEPSPFRSPALRRDQDPGWAVDGTLATVVLPRPLEPGGSVQIEIGWSYTVSGGGGFRQGHLNHRVFNIAQWYPQVAVIDDVFGPDMSPYLGNGEFYCDYGDFRVDVTVPQGWIVVGTGVLQNPGQVLTPEAAGRLARAAALDTVISIVSARDRAAGRATAGSATGKLTWRFAAENVRDFAFATSDRYVWDATGAETGSESGRALIQNVYDPEVGHWAEATLYGKHAIEFFSDYILPYPYPHATTAYGPPDVRGMEYPMITFIERSGPGRPLESVVTHELSHFWMPMIVGTKENAYAWMDEGLTVFNTSLALNEARGPESDDGQLYRQVVRLGLEEPVMGHMDHARTFFGAQLAAYGKPGMLLHALRRMMGEEKFDAAYRDYARSWAYKHPMPWDFFAMMETAAEVDLDWFWQAWFYQTATLDQAIEEVVAAPGGVEVTVANLADAVMPVELRLRLADGTVTTVVWPVGVWVGTRRVSRVVPVSGEVVRIEIDPEGVYMDLDPSNNVWEGSIR